jgi:hypothetical protein
MTCEFAEAANTAIWGKGSFLCKLSLDELEKNLEYLLALPKPDSFPVHPASSPCEDSARGDPTERVLFFIKHWSDGECFFESTPDLEGVPSYGVEALLLECPCGGAGRYHWSRASKVVYKANAYSAYQCFPRDDMSWWSAPTDLLREECGAAFVSGVICGAPVDQLDRLIEKGASRWVFTAGAAFHHGWLCDLLRETHVAVATKARNKSAEIYARRAARIKHAEVECARKRVAEFDAAEEAGRAKRQCR